MFLFCSVMWHAKTTDIYSCFFACKSAQMRRTVWFEGNSRLSPGRNCQATHPPQREPIHNSYPPGAYRPQSTPTKMLPPTLAPRLPTGSSQPLPGSPKLLPAALGPQPPPGPPRPPRLPPATPGCPVAPSGPLAPPQTAPREALFRTFVG